MYYTSDLKRKGVDSIKDLKINVEYTDNDGDKKDDKKTSKIERILEGFFISLTTSLIVLLIKILFGL